MKMVESLPENIQFQIKNLEFHPFLKKEIENLFCDP